MDVGGETTVVKVVVASPQFLETWTPLLVRQFCRLVFRFAAMTKWDRCKRSLSLEDAAFFCKALSDVVSEESVTLNCCCNSAVDPNDFVCDVCMDHKRTEELFLGFEVFMASALRVIHWKPLGVEAALDAFKVVPRSDVGEVLLHEVAMFRDLRHAGDEEVFVVIDVDPDRRKHVFRNVIGMEWQLCLRTFQALLARDLGLEVGSYEVAFVDCHGEMNIKATIIGSIRSHCENTTRVSHVSPEDLDLPFVHDKLCIYSL